MSGVAAPQPRRDNKGDWHLDLRGLQPPQPFVATMRLIESLRADAAVIHLQLDRDPLPLYAELAERGWRAERIDAGSSEVRLQLTRLG